STKRALPMSASSEWKSLSAPVSGVSVLRISFMKQLLHFLVTGLREIFVPEPDGLERIGRAQADDFDSLVVKLLARLRRGDRHRDGDRLRFHLSKSGDGGAHRRAGRKAVVDDDHCLVAHVERRPRSAVAGFA